MPARDEMWIDDILDASKEAAQFVRGRTRADLDTDRQLTLSLVKLVENIGEAASNISSATKTALPTIPWSEVVQMRNRLVHAYFNVNLDILWDTVIDDLPELVKELTTHVGGE